MKQERVIERDVDCRKHRKSTHLASADLDIMETEGNSLIFAIEDAYYDNLANVNGKLMEGYFVKLKGVTKHLKLNTENKDMLSVFSGNKGFGNIEKHNLKTWIGLLIELYVKRDVKYRKEIVNGIRIKPLQPVIKKEKPVFTEDKITATFDKGITIEKIKEVYTITKEIEQKYLEHGAKK